MTKLEQAARQALGALEGVDREFGSNNAEEHAIAALREALTEPVKLAISKKAFNWIDANAPMFVREALAEPDIEEMTLTQIAARHDQTEQKRVAWANPHDLERLTIDMKVRACGCPLYTVPLYATPVRTKYLTDDEIADVFRTTHMKESWSLDFARAVIAADREKNK